MEAKEPEQKPYKTPWLVPFLVWSYRFWGAPIWWWFGKAKVFGRENVPKTGSLLILANHLSITDPPFTQFACPRRVFYMASDEIFGWGWAGKFARWYGAVPVKTKSADRAALRRCGEILKEGGALVVYPEGGTSPGGLQPLFSGPAMLVRQTDCTVICLGLRNTNEIIAHNEFKTHRSKKSIEAHWGMPKKFEPKTSSEEIMAWAEEELLRLSAQTKALPEAQIHQNPQP